MQPYGRGGSKSANAPSKATQAATGQKIGQFVQDWGLPILLAVGTIAIGACIVATVGICATVGVPGEAALLALDGADAAVTETAASEAVNGAAQVRAGQAAEAAVKEAYNIGEKETVQVGGRTRILDGFNRDAVSEVKNVKYQAFTQQLKDSLEYAKLTGRRFDLYTRSDTKLSKDLEDAIAKDPLFNRRDIP